MQARRCHNSKGIAHETTVQPGGKVEIVSPELEAGQTVDVVAHSTNC